MVTDDKKKISRRIMTTIFFLMHLYDKDAKKVELY